MQCTCNTVLNFTADAVTIDGVIVENEVNTEQIITDILVNRSNAERQEIAKEYNKLFKKVNIITYLPISKNIFIIPIIKI